MNLHDRPVRWRLLQEVRELKARRGDVLLYDPSRPAGHRFRVETALPEGWHEGRADYLILAGSLEALDGRTLAETRALLVRQVEADVFRRSA